MHGPFPCEFRALAGAAAVHPNLFALQYHNLVVEAGQLGPRYLGVNP